VEIDGHPPIPLAQNMGFHLGSFFTVFRVLNLRDHFEALNEFFGHDNAQMMAEIMFWAEWNMYSAARPFRGGIEHPKRRSYANLMPLGS
jgi:hypothetical protein